MQQFASTAMIGNANKIATFRVSSTRSIRNRSVVAASSNGSSEILDRRAVLAGTMAALVALTSAPAEARWDGESSAIGSCALGDAGDECRKAILTQDQLGSYSSASNNSAKIGNTATGIPVATLDKKYVADTSALADKIEKYYTIDLEDPARVPLVKELKKDGQDWVSKYARGGSARTVSARKFYVAVDAIGGHIALNGYAPFPRSKLEKVVNTLEESRALLAQGK